MNANHCLLNSSFDDSSQRYFYLGFQQSNWHNHQKTTIKININCLDLWKINLIIAMIIKIIIIITRPSRKVFNIDEGLHPPLSCQPTSIGPSLKNINNHNCSSFLSLSICINGHDVKHSFNLIKWSLPSAMITPLWSIISCCCQRWECRGPLHGK